MFVSDIRQDRILIRRSEIVTDTCSDVQCVGPCDSKVVKSWREEIGQRQFPWNLLQSDQYGCDTDTEDHELFGADRLSPVEQPFVDRRAQVVGIVLASPLLGHTPLPLPGPSHRTSLVFVMKSSAPAKLGGGSRDRVRPWSLPYIQPRRYGA